MILLINAASALQIAAYLTVSRFKHHEFRIYTSNAGIDSLVTRLRIGRIKARDVISSLLDIKYLNVCLMEQQKSYLAEKTYDFLPEAVFEYEIIQVSSKLPPNKTNRTQDLKNRTKRWKLNGSGKEIWLDNRVVDSNNLKTLPLYDLWRICGDTCARLFLLMIYVSDNLSGVVGSRLLFWKYHADFMVRINNVDIWSCIKVDTLTINYIAVSKYVYHYKEDINTDLLYIEVMNDLNTLERLNFIERIVSVTVNKLDNTSMSYILDVKSLTKSRLQDTAFCSEITDAVIGHGLKSPRNDKRHYNNYYAIASDYKSLTIQMAYRIKFRVSNPNNYRVSQAKANQSRNDDDVRHWLKLLAGSRQEGPWTVA